MNTSRNLTWGVISTTFIEWAYYTSLVPPGLYAPPYRVSNASTGVLYDTQKPMKIQSLKNGMSLPYEGKKINNDIVQTSIESNGSAHDK